MLARFAGVEGSAASGSLTRLRSRAEAARSREPSIVNRSRVRRRTSACQAEPGKQPDALMLRVNLHWNDEMSLAGSVLMSVMCLHVEKTRKREHC